MLSDLSELLGAPTGEVYYDIAVGRYRDEQGKFISRAYVLKLLDEEVARMRVRFRGHARLWRSQRLSNAEFRERVLDDLKLTYLRMSALAAGGMSALTEEMLEDIGERLYEQERWLDNYIEDEQSDNQALARAVAFATTTKMAFHLAEKFEKQRVEKKTEARRSLDPQANHCLSCIQYCTNGRWLPINEVVPPTIDCQCRQNCRCIISYR